ncbi:nitric oxide reductase transcription regulator [Pigmentiphaga sp. NML080357]|uniref:nitric oxide reductase transcriptional regulator NorR n=1 Tax=Pigmentiphaga sp. NML080357 TaxID=2008675 RepID=UPI000B4087BA|nr:nitric oxide reductase transcriptional regulator NorR [Pigmentiphaga sp. NML080357]OVZ55565.1 nitric oxide reductase transcription regulator [Pigmentiphaga sp. NML080357]
MTANALLHALVPLVDDLARDLAEGERYRRLLKAVRALVPCDATALLRLDGEWLVPLAVDGLSGDTLGRRFKVDEHPRFQLLLQSGGPTRFPAGSRLPDPYDGLVEGMEGEQLEVHDCLGCVLRVGEHPWGLLTLDALEAGRFSEHDLDILQTFASLAAATVSVADRLQQLASRASDEHQRAEIYRAAAETSPRPLLGQSAVIRRLLDEVRTVGASDLTVLVTGETGVGKELVAQALHAASPRAARPLVSLNCAALPEALVESELFGHVKGAFSGAVGDRRGKFELADGGTLLLDEVGELPLTVQAKLLRVLQSGQLQRVGSDREHHVDVRLIAATNRDLAEEVRKGRFRADLYHRLSVYPLRVPPLRERGRDVLLLSGAFLEENRSRLGLRNLRLAADAQAALLAYDWPGNVRELEHLIGRSALKALSRQAKRPAILTLTAADLGLEEREAGPPAPALDHTAANSAGVSAQPLKLAVDDYQRSLIVAALRRHGNNWSAAARELGVDRANLARLAGRLGLRSAASGS